MQNHFNVLNLESHNSDNLLYKKPTYHNMPSQENNFTGQQKIDKQKLYREYLNQQVSLLATFLKIQF